MKRLLLLSCLFLLCALPVRSQTFTPKALVVASLPAQVQGATGKLTATVPYPGTQWQIHNVGTVNLIVYHLASGLDYPGIIYNDTSGQTFNMTSPTGIIFVNGGVSVTGGTHYKTASDAVAFTLTQVPTKPFHLHVTVTSSTGVPELLMDGNLSTSLSTVILPSTVQSVEQIGDANLPTTQTVTQIVNAAYSTSTLYFYANRTIYVQGIVSTTDDLLTLEVNGEVYIDTGKGVNVTVANGEVVESVGGWEVDIPKSGLVTYHNADNSIQGSFQMKQPGQLSIMEQPQALPIPTPQ